MTKTKSNLNADIVIIGAGIIGITIALELKKRFPDQKIIIIEKESHAGFHASGRNSGVLHAGFYYTNDSLKARFCRDGNRAMTQYCLENNLKINQNGKLVITKNESELKTLQTLYDRGIKNNVNLKLISEIEAREIEPRVRTIKQALFSPDTASVDPIEVMKSLVRDAENKEIEFLYNEKFLKHDQKEKTITTSKRKIHTGYLVNAAGLYADKIAKQYGFGLRYEIVPFKGLYLYSNEKVGALKTHIYPVPDLNYPFLGVHFTVTAHGKIKIGPTAIPAFWREQYKSFHHFSLLEMLKIIKREMILFAKNKFHFREVAIHELKKYQKKFLANQAAYMIENMRIQDYKTWGKPGIRAQLIDMRDNTLVNDFCYEGDDRSFHVLNAVSPAFTCSFPLSSFLADCIERAL
ncbi:MAG TPA: L-2-hydroxyglutarate oxidase [Coxiellaceae bacterium]|nr:MAG: FAD-dependent oxidoreductase [Gammaproteobacteria bacterium RIFCSPHIGHO2_12_FULL_36_30]HLB55895.1 L-2-hydroxyglutarate oxidase [Coxiellaceae bacterium]